MLLLLVDRVILLVVLDQLLLLNRIARGRELFVQLRVLFVDPLLESGAYVVDQVPPLRSRLVQYSAIGMATEAKWEARTWSSMR